MSLQEQRKKAGLSQSELAALSGVNVRMIQKYEQGSNDIDKALLSTICSLALATDSKIYDILQDNDLKIRLRKII